MSVFYVFCWELVGLMLGHLRAVGHPGLEVLQMGRTRYRYCWEGDGFGGLSISLAGVVLMRCCGGW